MTEARVTPRDTTSHLLDVTQRVTSIA